MERQIPLFQILGIDLLVGAGIPAAYDQEIVRGAEPPEPLVPAGLPALDRAPGLGFGRSLLLDQLLRLLQRPFGTFLLFCHLFGPVVVALGVLGDGQPGVQLQL